MCVRASLFVSVVDFDLCVFVCLPACVCVCVCVCFCVGFACLLLVLPKVFGFLGVRTCFFVCICG